MAEEGSADAALLDALHVLMMKGYVLPETRLALRQTSRGFRDAYDRSLTYFSFGKRPSTAAPDNWQAPSPEALTAAVGAAALRGCRPLELRIDDMNRMGSLTAEKCMLALLTGFAPGGSVMSLHLGPEVPVTSDVARAIADLSPRLERLTMFNFDSEAHTLLMRLVGPCLTQLSITSDNALARCAYPSVSFCTALVKLKLSYAAPPGTPDDRIWAAEMSTMEAIATLTNLRHLDVHLVGDQPADMQRRDGRAAALLQPLSSLTALTRLDIQVPYLNHHPRFNGPDLHAIHFKDIRLNDVSHFRHSFQVAKAEWRALVALVKQLPRLQSLRTCAEANAFDLATLTNLTSLRVGFIVLWSPPEGGAAAGTGAVSYSLPPQLQRLETNKPLPVSALAALQPPAPQQQQPGAGAGLVLAAAPGPGLAAPTAASCSLLVGGRLCARSATPWCLYFGDTQIHGGNLLKATAAAEMRRLASTLASFGFAAHRRRAASGRGLRVSVGRGPVMTPVGPPIETAQEPVPEGGGARGAGLGDGHCATWLAELVAVVRPVHLELCRLVLSSRDMLGMARCLQGVEVLHLESCEYSVTSLPLLAGLASLRELHLEMDNWDDCTTEDLGSREEDAVQSAFLALTARVESRGAAAGGPAGAADLLPLRGLRLLEVRCTSNGMTDWLEDALWPVREELARRGGPTTPQLRVATWWRL